MLGRTANNVYWMARYVERAENLARLLASTYHMSLLPVASGNDAQQWEAPLQLAGDREDFIARFGESSPGNVLAYMALDRRQRLQHPLLRSGSPARTRGRRGRS